MSTKTTSFVFRVYSVILLFTLLFSAVGVTTKVSAGTNVWTSNGPEGGTILTLAIDPTTPTILYVGTDGGMFKSTNSGETWSTINTGLTNNSVRTLAIDLTTPTTIYAGSMDGVFKSTDGGENWNAVNSGLTDTDVRVLVIDPMTPTILYIGTYGGGMFKSTNGGENWSAVNISLNGTMVWTLEIDPVTPSTIYAGTWGGGMFKSTNGGESWSAVNNGLTDLIVCSLAIDSAAPATLYVGTYNSGVFKSTNGGENWSAVKTGLTQAMVWTLAIDPAMPTTLYAGTEGDGVFKSTNGGGNWIKVNTGLTSKHISVVTINPLMPDILYAGTGVGGMFKSTNGGGNWNAFNTGLPHTFVDIVALAIDPVTPSTVFAGIGYGGGVFKSANGGESWNAVNTGLTYTDVAALAIDPSTPTTLYVATNGGVFKSTNGGGNWSPINTDLTATNVSTLVIDPMTPTTLYVGTYNGGAFKSTNGGENWNPINNGLPENYVSALAINPLMPTTLYAGIYGAPGTNTGVFKSTNGGGNWSAVNTGLSPDAGILALAIDPTTPTTIYAGTAIGARLYKSTNGGGSWSAANIGLSGLSVESLVIDPTSPTTLYAGTYEGGVFKSKNGGGNWSAFNNGLTVFRIHALAIAPTRPTFLYAGTENGVASFNNSATTSTVTSITRASTNPTIEDSVNFTVTFSEFVMGVDTASPFNDFALTTSSGISDASVASVSGSGATYTVTVDTGSGKGTIRLDVPLSATITDLAGNLLADLPYTDGETYTITKNLPPFTNCAAQTQIPATECNALVALYTSANGANWTNNTGWLQTDTPCTWYGIVCANGSNVTELDLSYNNLTGAIPPELGNLSNLQVLYLGLPRLISINPEILSTPPELGNLVNLQNQLGGAIPPELGNLTNLRLLALSDNRLSGAIPPQLGNLTNLQMLALDSNQLSGAIPHELGNLPNLQELYLRFNQLSGTIPPELGNLTKLGIFALSNNRLSGSIPPELGNLASLHYLVLNNNQLNGVIPPELGNLAGLELFILSDNRLSGSIPAELGNLTNLGWLYLHGNLLSGELPISITNLTSLATLTFDCWISSTDPSVIAFIEALVPGWQNNTCPIVLSITRGNPNPTSNPSVKFTVTFSESVMGVGVTDFNLATSNITGASITNVSGSGTTYIVAVLTGTPNDSSIGLININSATLTELDSLPGIGPTIAQRIIDYRTLNGPFYMVEDIMNVSGIGPATFENIKNLITVGGAFLRLDVPVGVTISDLSGNPLSRLPFNTGETYTINKNIEVYIGGALKGSYFLTPNQSTRQNYAGVDSGPVKVISRTGIPIISAIRSTWAVNGVTTSFSQLMGLPLEQLSDTYVFPGYNNVTLNDQLRIANVDTSPTSVTVTIGGIPRGTYPLAAGAAVRINYPGLDSGPVVVQGTSGVKIISSIREAWAVNGVTTSFVQLMGLPAGQLSNKYVFPAYNNVTLNEQLRIGNVDPTQSTSVTVTIGGNLKGTYPLGPGQAVRINYPGLDSGPVVVEGTAGVNIISSIRSAWAVNGVTTSFSQLMGMPAEQLADKYLFPGYNNVTLNDQLRIANVDTVPTTVTVTIGGTLRGTYPLAAGAAVRIDYPGLDSGPVVVQGTSGVKIISSIREAWAVNGVTQSFVQLMGLPAGQLSTTYFFPGYNNVTLNEQLRIGMP